MEELLGRYPRNGFYLWSKLVVLRELARRDDYQRLLHELAVEKEVYIVFWREWAEELRKDGISILADCPGPTQMEFWLSGAKPFFLLQPNAVVDLALKKLGRKIAVVAGWTNSIIAFSTRLLPRSLNAKIDFIGNKLFDSENSRDGRVSRQKRPRKRLQYSDSHSS